MKLKTFIMANAEVLERVTRAVESEGLVEKGREEVEVLYREQKWVSKRMVAQMDRMDRVLRRRWGR